MGREWCYCYFYYHTSGLFCCTYSEALDNSAAPLGKAAGFYSQAMQNHLSWSPKILKWNMKWSPSMLAPSLLTTVCYERDIKRECQKMMTEIPTIFLLFCFDKEVFCRATFRHLIKNNVSRAFLLQEMVLKLSPCLSTALLQDNRLII